MNRNALALALCAAVAACTGHVDHYAADGRDGGSEATSGGAMPSEQQSAETAVEGEDLPGEPCEGDAMCWPWGLCSNGYCVPSMGGECTVGGEVTQCGTEEVCCDLGEALDCAKLDDCPT